VIKAVPLLLDVLPQFFHDLDLGSVNAFKQNPPNHAHSRLDDLMATEKAE